MPRFRPMAVPNRRHKHLDTLLVILAGVLWWPHAYATYRPGDTIQPVTSNGAPCTTQIDIIELGHGSLRECLKQAKKLTLKPIQGHKLVPWTKVMMK